MELFRQNLGRALDSEECYFIFSIHGQGGVGKTALLKKYDEIAREVPRSKIMRQLVNYVDLQPHTIREKVKVMLEHFVGQTARNINSRARAMVVTRSRLHCVKYMLEMRRQMQEMGLPYSCLCGFSGTVKDPDTGKEYTENSLNGLDRGVSIPYGLKDPRHQH